jgi:hypothetical protein
MGGLVPLGYDAEDRTLVVNETEAGTVRTIFQLYLELGCARRVKEAADRQGLLSKYRRFDSGKTFGGDAFTRGGCTISWPTRSISVRSAIRGAAIRASTRRSSTERSWTQSI